MICKNLVTANYHTDNFKPIIHLFKRKNGKKIVEEIKDFFPFFYIEEQYIEDLEKNFSRDIISIEKSYKKYILDENKELYKVTHTNPFAIYNIKNLFPTYESDINFPLRYIIENIEKLETDEKLRINMFDIETTSEQGFPDYNNPKEKIISISAYDNYLDKFFLWSWHESYKKEIEETEEEAEINNNKIKEKLEIRRFENEKEMADNFLDFINETKPDYITSWHVSFDIPYLFARIEHIGLEKQKLSPLYNTKYQNKYYKGLAQWKKGAGVYGKRFGITEIQRHPDIVGLEYFDMLTAYKNVVFNEKSSWKLDDVAQEELEMKKLRTHFDIGKEWKTNPKFIEKYNYVDVLILKYLDKKMKIIERYHTIKDKAFLFNINDAFAQSRVLDAFIMKKYKDKYIFPSKVYSENNNVEVAGGFVRQPKAGVYHNVAVFDFSGYYPNLMKTFNLSGEKLIEENIKWLNRDSEEESDIDDWLNEKMYEYDDKKQEIVYKIRTGKFNADLKYKLDEMGTMPSSVDEFMQLRKKYKKEMEKHKYGTLDFEQWYNAQFSMKFLINSSYGISAFPGYRLFKQNNANAITGFARMGSKYIEKRLANLDWKTVGGDTDSVFVQLHSKTPEENIEEINKINELIKTFIDDFARKFLPEKFAEKHTLKMDCEKIYSDFLLLDVKKRYCGYLSFYEGKIVNKKFHLMGLDSKKSNTTLISKNAALELAKTILDKGDIFGCMKKYYELCKKEEDVNLFKISSKLEKPQESYTTKTPAVKGSIWSNENLNTKFRAGTKFYLLYVKGLPVEQIAFEDEEQLKDINFKIDKQKYMKDIYNKFDNLIRGVPEFSNLNAQCFQRFIKNNHNLQEYGV